MKLFITLLLLFTSFYSANASSGISSVTKPIPISVYELANMKVKEFEAASGKHLNLFERFAFKMQQKQLKKNLKIKGSTFDGDMTTGFHAGGFFLGMILGPIGLLVSYLIKGDEDVVRNRRKWAWIGFGVFITILTFVLKLLVPVGA